MTDKLHAGKKKKLRYKGEKGGLVTTRTHSHNQKGEGANVHRLTRRKERNQKGQAHTTNKATRKDKHQTRTETTPKLELQTQTKAKLQEVHKLDGQLRPEPPSMASQEGVIPRDWRVHELLRQLAAVGDRKVVQLAPKTGCRQVGHSRQDVQPRREDPRPEVRDHDIIWEACT